MNSLRRNYKLNNYIIYLILLVIPFIQLGISYYVSISFVTFMIALFLSLKTKTINKVEFNIIVGVSFIFIFKSILLLALSIDNREVLIPLRELLCFTAIIIISKSISKSNINEIKMRKIIVFLLMLIFCSIVLQKYFLSLGIYFGFPINLYVMNQATLVGIEKALFSQTYIRANSFFAEPSYTAWIVFVILTITLLQNRYKIKNKFYAVIFCLLIAFLSESIAGILSICLIASLWVVNVYATRRNTLLFFLTFIIIGLFAFVAISCSSTEFTNRLGNALASSDESTNIRILEPLLIIQNMSLKEIIVGADNYSTFSVDNAGLALFVHYGVMSFGIVGLLWKFLKEKFLFLFFFISFFFNGAILSFDKVLLLSIVFGLGEFYRIERLKKTL